MAGGAHIPRSVELFSLESLVMPPFHQRFSVAPDGKSFIFYEDRATFDKKGRYAQVTLNWLDSLKEGPTWRLGQTVSASCITEVEERSHGNH